jgi:hypothetical protein
MVVEPVLGARVKVEVHDGKTLAQAEVLPIRALVVVDALQPNVALTSLSEDVGQDGAGTHPIEVAMVVDRKEA